MLYHGYHGLPVQNNNNEEQICYAESSMTKRFISNWQMYKIQKQTEPLKADKATSSTTNWWSGLCSYDDYQ